MKNKFNLEIISNRRPDIKNPQETVTRTYCLFPKDNAVTSSLYSAEVYEPHIFQFIIENKIDITSTTVIDIGGNNGQLAIEFAHLVGDKGRVITFEPQRIIFQQLCGNVFINGLDNVWAFNIAIGDENGVTNIEKPDYFSKGPLNLGNVHVGLETSSEPVIINTLDSFNLENVSIIKIDVQGFEKKVLLGALETIKKNKPIIFIEIENSQLELYGDNENSILEILIKYGYSFTRFNEGRPYHTESGFCLDFVAIPNDFVNIKKWKTIFD